MSDKDRALTGEERRGAGREMSDLREEAIRAQAKMAREALDQFITRDGEWDQDWQAEDVLVAYLLAADAEGHARGVAQGREEAWATLEGRALKHDQEAHKAWGMGSAHHSDALYHRTLRGEAIACANAIRALPPEGSET